MDQVPSILVARNLSGSLQKSTVFGYECKFGIKSYAETEMPCSSANCTTWPSLQPNPDIAGIGVSALKATTLRDLKTSILVLSKIRPILTLSRFLLGLVFLPT